MPFVCSTTSSGCEDIASTMRSMPLTSANACSPGQRFPTRPDIASIPANCAGPQLTCACIRECAAGMAEPFTKASEKSLISFIASTFASISQAVAAMLSSFAGGAASTNFLAKNSGVATSLARSCSTSWTMTSFGAWPASGAKTVKRARKGLLSGGTLGGGPFSGPTSAETIRATVSCALPQISLDSGFCIIEFTITPITSLDDNFSNARLDS
mmetsp:Transcript_12402/g.20276  ORF Transcript_12402/g.20276 Transcript_12402/m.20276 type:complete len:213 (-) Transcript_12402:564-1202(-)